MRQDQVIGVIADGGEVYHLRSQGLSWSEVAARFVGNREISLSCAEADWLVKNEFAFWIDRRRRMLVSTRFVRRLSDLSARIGFDSKGNTASTVGTRRSEFGHVAESFEWVGPFIRAQFKKREQGGRNVRSHFDDARRGG